jgi:hypothetical protein
MVETTQRRRARPVERDSTPALLRLLEQLRALEARIGRRRDQLAELDEERDRLRGRLSRWIDYGYWRVGPYLVRRSKVEPVDTIDAWSAIEDNVVDEKTLRPYMHPRAVFDRWTLKLSSGTKR